MASDCMLGQFMVIAEVWTLDLGAEMDESPEERAAEVVLEFMRATCSRSSKHTFLQSCRKYI